MFPSQRRRKSQSPLSSEKVNPCCSAMRNREAHLYFAVQSSLTTMLEITCLICVGGPLVYDSVQLVQNSAALNGTQRVLLDQVISEEECSDLRHLAHVRTFHDIKGFKSPEPCEPVLEA